MRTQGSEDRERKEGTTRAIWLAGILPLHRNTHMPKLLPAGNRGHAHMHAHMHAYMHTALMPAFA
jgi:hypothetical protein